MITTLTTWEAADRLTSDEFANWSSEGAHAMIEYLEQLEDDLGERIEFDRVAIRCDYSEYPSARDAASEWGYEKKHEDEEQDEAAALEWLEQKTTVIRFEGGVIVQAF